MNETEFELSNATVKEPVNFYFEFIVPGVLLNAVGVLGLVGNLLTIFILSRPQMKGSTNCILIGLATYDSILILSSILMFGLPSVYNYSQYYFSFYYLEIFPYITPFVYPIGLIAQTSSAYLTLCVTVERYVAVCLPLKARSICTYGRARVCVLSLGAASVLYNIPRFFEVTWKVVYCPETGANRTEIQATDIRQNPTYISVYITWMYLVVMYIVPFTSLALLNLRIYVQVRKANAERAQLSRLQQREIGLATMLLCVVIVFFACNVLALVANVLEMMSISLTALTQISNLMVTLNSSVNFIIYCIYGEKFKRLFCSIFCSRCGGDKEDNQVMLRRYTTTKSSNNHRVCFSSESFNGAGGRHASRHKPSYMDTCSYPDTNHAASSSPTRSDPGLGLGSHANPNTLQVPLGLKKNRSACLSSTTMESGKAQKSLTTSGRKILNLISDSDRHYDDRIHSCQLPGRQGSCCSHRSCQPGIGQTSTNGRQQVPGPEGGCQSGQRRAPVTTAQIEICSTTDGNIALHHRLEKLF